MRRPRTDANDHGRVRIRVVIVGFGIAGATTAYNLARSGDFDVWVVPGLRPGSTYFNQKWWHSGLLFSNVEFARRMWSAHRATAGAVEPYLQVRRGARFLALTPDTVQLLDDRWKQWDIASWGVDVRPLTPAEYGVAGLLGPTNAVGGFGTPDAVIDYPALVQHLRARAESFGAHYLENQEAAVLETSESQVVGVRLTSGETVRSDFCVVSTGAWTVPFLARQSLSVPIILRRCLVIEFEGEIVPVLTVCFDIRPSGGGSRDAALVPFRRRTLGAEADGDVVGNLIDERPGRVRISRLVDEYAACFPRIHTFDIVASRYCYKTEHSSRDGSPRDYRLYDSSSIPSLPSRMAVAIPGKASLAFTMASHMEDHIRRELGA